MTKRKEHTWDAPVRVVRNMTQPHPSIFDGHYRRITPNEVAAATRLVKRLGGTDAPAILTMLGIAS